MPSDNKWMVIACPVSGATAGSTTVPAGASDGVVNIATTASSARFDIPKGWQNRTVTFKAIGLDIAILFGTSAVAVAANQASGVASEVITPNATTGFTILAGTKEDFFIPRNKAITDFAIISSGTSGRLEAYPSDVIHPSTTEPF